MWCIHSSYKYILSLIKIKHYVGYIIHYSLSFVLQYLIDMILIVMSLNHPSFQRQALAAHMLPCFNIGGQKFRQDNPRLHINHGYGTPNEASQSPEAEGTAIKLVTFTLPETNIAPENGWLED